MSGAVVLSATGVAVDGGLLWARAKIYIHQKTIKNMFLKTVDSVKKDFKAVKGWIGK